MSWLNKLKKYAPSIVGAVLSGGATLPQLAFEALSDATGVDIKTEADAEKAVNAMSPSQLIEMKKADQAYCVAIKKLENDLFSTELKGFQEARETNKHSRMPAAICCALTVMVALGAYALFTLNIPDGNKEIAYLLFGTALAKWGDSIAYWVGTTRSSAEKSKGFSK